MDKRRKRAWLVAIVAIVLVAVLFMFIGMEFPKQLGRFPLYFLLFGVDIYLWVSIRKRLRALGRKWQLPLTFIYWMPLGLYLIESLLSLVIPLNHWIPGLMVSLLGAILVFYFSKLFAVLFFLAADLYRIIRFSILFSRDRLTRKPPEQRTGMMSRARFLETVGLAGGGLMFSGLLTGMVKWAHDFRVKDVEIFLPNLPASFDGFRIVQISDLHLGSWATTRPMEEAVEIVNDLDADVVLFTGDLVNLTTNEAYRFKDILGSVRSRQGTFAILGNHDYGDYVSWHSEADRERNMDKLYRYFEDIDWRLLRNENHLFTSGEGDLALIGVENWSAVRRFRTAGDLHKAMQGTESAAARILMSHDPTHWEHEVSKKHPEIDLTLSGHTHGFQLGIEYRNFKWSVAQYVYKYWAGLYSVDHGPRTQYLYVNRGLGMSGYPGRVGILPEITHITLRQ